VSDSKICVLAGDIGGTNTRLAVSKVSLLNDLEATAWGIRTLKAEDFNTLQQGAAEATGNAAIYMAAQQGRDAICVEALDMFAHLYGVEAGNLALKLMATGGLYIAGGIAPRILQQLQSGTFMEAFLAKGRMQNLLERIPVRVVLNDEAGLRGAAFFAAV
jgi:glucokinase